MWNPIASGSTDLWQHVWMYYSMPVEVEAAGGWTQNRRQASLKKTIRAHILQRRKDLKYTDKKQPLPPPPDLTSSVVAPYATDWNLESVHRAAAQKTKKQKRRIEDGAWPPRGHGKVLPNRSCCSSRRRSQHFIFIAVMFNHLLWELGHLLPPPNPSAHPPVSPSPSFTPSRRRFRWHKEVLPKT